MKAIFFFYIGAVIDILILFSSLSTVAYMFTNTRYVSPWPSTLALLALSALVGAAFWFKSQDKLLIANILLWIPAAPVFISALGWVFLAVIFNVAGK